MILSSRYMRTPSNTETIGSRPSRCQTWRSIWTPVVNSTGIDSTIHEGDDGVIARVYRADKQYTLSFMLPWTVKQRAILMGQIDVITEISRRVIFTTQFQGLKSNWGHDNLLLVLILSMLSSRYHSTSQTR